MRIALKFEASLSYIVSYRPLKGCYYRLEDHRRINKILLKDACGSLTALSITTLFCIGV